MTRRCDCLKVLGASQPSLQTFCVLTSRPLRSHADTRILPSGQSERTCGSTIQPILSPFRVMALVKLNKSSATVKPMGGREPRKLLSEKKKKNFYFVVVMIICASTRKQSIVVFQSHSRMFSVWSFFWCVFLSSVYSGFLRKQSSPRPLTGNKIHFSTCALNHLGRPPVATTSHSRCP